MAIYSSCQQVGLQMTSQSGLLRPEMGPITLTPLSPFLTLAHNDLAQLDPGESEKCPHSLLFSISFFSSSSLYLASLASLAELESECRTT